jgi:hypothetical protein
MEKRQKTITVFVASDGSEHMSEMLCVAHEAKLEEARQHTITQKMGAATMRFINASLEHDRAMRCVAFDEHPGSEDEEHEMFIQALRHRKDMFMQMAIRLKWWKDVDAKGNPIPFPHIVKISSLAENEITMAHVLAKLELFPSISEARKNGWNKPVQTGEWWFRKKTFHLIIEE